MIWLAVCALWIVVSVPSALTLAGIFRRRDRQRSLEVAVRPSPEVSQREVSQRVSH